MAAIRTLSIHHPVLAVLNRFMYQVFGIQPLAVKTLFAPGAAVDQIFPHTGLSGKSYTDNLYKTRGGRTEANYFRTELRERGLLDSPFGPALKHFPFFEDAQRIHSALHTFFGKMIDSYYACNEDVVRDKEIQAWVKEAQGPAEVIDFPELNDRSSLAQLLTHYAHLTSTSHAGVNINELLDISLSIPFHSAALYKPVPSAKGEVDNVADWLPPYDKVINQFAVASIFARRNFIGTNRTLMHVFDHPKMLAQLNSETRAAAEEFKSTMADFSKEVKARQFDENGLSQGMPFVWQALDPDVIPYSVST
jgi:arachidonate 15-lipoxygenase (second type) / 8-lipoxygenase (S-type)